MFHYLNQSNCFELDDVDDSKEYLDTRRAMDIVGISPDEQVNCSLLLSMFPLVNYCFTKQVLYVFSLFLFFQGCNIPCCGCYSSFGQCWIFRRRGIRFICIKRWEITIPSQNGCWAFHVTPRFLHIHIIVWVCIGLHALSAYKRIMQLLIGVMRKLLRTHCANVLLWHVGRAL